MSGQSTIRQASADSAAKAWLRALERTAPIARNPGRIFPSLIEEMADQFGPAPALLSDGESLSYRALVEHANRYSRWALERGVGTGHTVALLMPNCPEYMAVWLGITKVGGVVALLNTNLTGASLAHCLNIVRPGHVIVGAGLLEAFDSAIPSLAQPPEIWAHGNVPGPLPVMDLDLDQYSGEALARSERRTPTVEDRALYIYTSGTTGLPKAANISHGRVLQWTNWFAGMMDTGPGDRMYNCLPMYHSVGGVQAPGAVLCGGGSVVIRDKFSASRFWSDVARWDCTLIQYIGELCRYLVNTAASPDENAHRLRMACGNGLKPDIWERFQSRFHIPRILEFYAATEGNVSLFNVEGEPGSIGRTPPYLAHRSPIALVKFDFEKQAPVRNENGFCIRCAANETGEAIGAMSNEPSHFGGRFEGYTSREASEDKILRDVFHPGDSWFRTGDLMRKSEKGFFYFVDRTGDTFRWKGENVSTLEVAEAVCAFPGVKQAHVYGVQIPGTDGRAGMAAIETEGVPDHLDLAALRAHLTQRLAEYARPLFLRIRPEIEVTSTFKYTKSDLVRQAFDPAATTDAVYFDDIARQAFVRVDDALYRRIQMDWPGCAGARRPLAKPTFQPAVIENLRRAAADLENVIENGPIVPKTTPQDIQNHLAAYDFAKPVPLETLVRDVEGMMQSWHVQVTHPRYLGLFNPSVTFPGIVGDTLAAMYNPQLATWRTSPAANEIERHTLAWLAGKFGLPADAAATFTSGGSEANFSAVIAALTHKFPDYSEHGIQSTGSPTIYMTAEAHHGYNKIAHMAGLGRRALQIIASDAHMRMDLADLSKRVAEDRKNGRTPLMVIGTAGTTAAGVIDPLPALVSFCRSGGLWLHVDAAWGGAAILSPRLKGCLAGIEGADSITCDAHKWLSVPMGAGMFFCRHLDSVARAFHGEISFMPARTPEVTDPYTTSAQWSRRFIGLKLFLTLAHYGEGGYAAMLEHQARMGDLLRELLAREGWRIVNTTPLPLVCFTRDGIEVSKFLLAMHERQIAWMSEVRFGPLSAIRACITSFHTNESHIRQIVREMGELL
jgi:fatty-acyl-CoA synthase